MHPLRLLPGGGDKEQTLLWVQSVFEKHLVIHRVKSLARVPKSSLWLRGWVCCALAVHGLETNIQGFRPPGRPGKVQTSSKTALLLGTQNHKLCKNIFCQVSSGKICKSLYDHHFKKQTKKYRLWHIHVPKIYTLVFFLMNIHFYIPFVRFMIALWFELPSP